jgi:long-chain acyl-CoA synthetase
MSSNIHSQTLPDTLPELFFQTTARFGNETAMRYKKLGIWHDISWNTYYQKARNVAAALIHAGFKKGDSVSIIGDNCPEWIFIDMGIQLAGGISVGIYATNAAEQCEYVINHSDSVFLFVENEEQLDKWLQIREKTPQIIKVIFWDIKGLRDFTDPYVQYFDDFINSVEDVSKYDSELENIRLNIKPDDTAILVYTSGTTGLPKGAVLSQKNLTWIARAILEQGKEININEKDEVMSFLPLCHIFERLFSVYIQLAAGYVVNFIESPDTVADNMREISPTVGYAVPRIWEKYYSAIYIKMREATHLKKLVYKFCMFF